MEANSFSLFSELYTNYYQVVAKILQECARRPLTRRQMEDIARKQRTCPPPGFACYLPATS